MYVKRTSDFNSGWGVELRWARTDAMTRWLHRLTIRGIQHPGAWSDFQLRIGRADEVFDDWVVKSHYFGYALDSLQSLDRTYDRRYTVRFPPIDARPFWKLAQAARRGRDQGAASALVDWLCESGPAFLCPLIQEGVAV